MEHVETDSLAHGKAGHGSRKHSEAAQATGKGLRHGFGIACVLKNRPLHKIRDWLGHTNTETTEIYTTVIGAEDRELLMGVWGDDGEK